MVWHSLMVLFVVGSILHGGPIELPRRKDEICLVSFLHRSHTFDPFIHLNIGHILMECNHLAQIRLYIFERRDEGNNLDFTPVYFCYLF